MTSNPVAADIYSAAGIGSNIGPGRSPLVLVVDLQIGFTDPACGVGFNLDRVVWATHDLLAAARDASVPVVFTRIAYSSPSDVGIWAIKLPGLTELVDGSQWIDIDPRLGRREDELVVTKRGASGLFGTDLSRRLDKLDIDTVIVCGATTSGCVRATVVDLLQRGLIAIVPTQCVGDRADEPHAAALFDIRAKYGDVVDVASAIEYVRGRRP